MTPDQMRTMVALTPAEQAADAAANQTPDAQAAMERELGRTTNPSARGILAHYYQQQFGMPPPGMSASAGDSAQDAPPGSAPRGLPANYDPFAVMASRQAGTPAALSQPAARGPKGVWDVPAATSPEDLGLGPSAPVGGSDFLRGLKDNAQEIIPTMKGAIGYLGAVAENRLGAGGNATAVKDWGIKGYTDGMKSVQANAKDSDSLSNAWAQAKTGNAHALLDWASYAAGQTAGYIAQAAATSVVGGAIGTAAGPEGTVGGAVAGAIDPSLIRTGLARLIAPMVAKEAARIGEASALKAAAGEGVELTGDALAKAAAEHAASDAVQQQAVATVAKTIGSGAGLATLGTEQGAGQIYTAAQAEADKNGQKLSGGDLTRVGAASVGFGLLHAATEALGLNALAGKIAMPEAKSAVLRAATAGGAGATAGAISGVGQTALTRFGEGKDLTGPGAGNEYLDSAAFNALGGAGTGAFAGAVHGGPSNSPDLSGTDSTVHDLSPTDAALNVRNDQLGAAVDHWRGTGSADPAFVQAKIMGAPDVDSAIAAATQVAQDHNAVVDAATGVNVAAKTKMQTEGARIAAMRAAVDRQAELLKQANDSGFQADKENALAQAQTAHDGSILNRGAETTGPQILPEGAMDQRTAQGRLRVLQDLEGQQGNDPSLLSVIPHPDVDGRFAIQKAPAPEAPKAEVPAAPAVSPEQAQAALAGAAQTAPAPAGPREGMRQAAVSRAMQNVADRQGVASPEEARLFADEGLGTPYDSVDPSLSRPLGMDEKLTAATGIQVTRAPRESSRVGSAEPTESDLLQQESNARSDSLMAKMAADKAAKAGVPPAERAAAEAPAIDDVVASLKTDPAFRTANDLVTIAKAKQTFTPDQMRILQNEATSKFGHSATDKLELQSMRDAETKMSEQRSEKTTDEATEQGKPVGGNLGNVSEVAPAALKNQSQAGSGELSRQHYTLTSHLARLFGKTVKVFASDNPMAPDGFVRKSEPNIIYLNKDSQQSHLVVFGHELFHHLARENPAAFDAIRKVAQLRDGANLDVRGIRGNHEELHADLFGNQMADPKFWGDVFREVMSKNDPATSRSSVMKLATSTARIVNSMLKALGGYKKFNTDSMVKNLDDVKGAMQKALAQYAIDRREQPVDTSGERVQKTAESEQVNSAKRDGQLDGVEAYHYSKAPRRVLDTSMYGTGLKGSGREEYQNAADQRRANRAYFYVDKGTGVRPEDGVGAYPHRASLDNVYDINKDPLALKAGTQAQTETNVLNAGFHGYMDRMDGTQPGQVIMLGKRSIPVERLEQGGNVRAAQVYKPDAKAADWQSQSQGPNKALLQQKLERMQANPAWAGHDLRVREAGSGFYSLDSKAKDDVQESAKRVMFEVAPDPHNKELKDKWDALDSGKKFEISQRVAEQVMPKVFEAAGVKAEVLPQIGGYLDDSNPSFAAVVHTDDAAKLMQVAKMGGFALSQDSMMVLSHEPFETSLPTGLISISKAGKDMASIHELYTKVRALDPESIQGHTTVDGEMILAVPADKGLDLARQITDTLGGDRDVNYAEGQMAFPTKEEYGYGETTRGQAADDHAQGGVAGDIRASAQAALTAELDAADQGRAGTPGVDGSDVTGRLSAKRDELKPKVAQALGKYVKHLTPPERAKLRVDTAQKLVDTIAKMPSAKEMATVAYAGKAKRGWYASSSQAIEHVFGGDAPRFAALLAALSPQVSVESNLFNALSTWKNWIKDGRPTDRESIMGVLAKSVQGNKGADSVLDAWVNNTVRALGSDDPSSVTISGPKVNSFMLNLRGHVHEVTNDAWMANYALVDQKIFSGKLNAAGTDPGKTPGYLAMSARVREAAAMLTKLTGDTWTPAEVQETVWSWAKTLYESASVDKSARDIINNRELRDDLIQSTPDFRTQFHDDVNEQLLTDAGYSDQLASLRGRTDLGTAGSEEPGAEGKTAPFAPDAQLKYESAAAKRLDQLRTQRAEAAADNGVTASEKRDDLFPEDFADKSTTVPTNRVIDSKGNTERGGNVNSDGQQITATKQGLQNFHDWFGSSEATDGTGKPLVLYHSTNADTSTLEAGRKTTNNYGLLGDVDTSRAGIFLTPERGFSQEYLRSGDGKNVMPVYAKLESPLDLRDGMSSETENKLVDAGISRRWLFDYRQHDWEMFDNDDNGQNHFVDTLKQLGYDGAIFHEEGQDGKSHETYMAFDSEQVKSALGNKGTFDPESKDVTLSEKRLGFSDALTPEQERALRKVGAFAKPQTLKEQLTAAKANWQLKLTQGLVDEFRAIKDVSPLGYMKARLSKGWNGALEATLLFGKPFMRDGAVDVDVKDQTGGYAKVLAKLGGEQQQFMWWLAGQRAEALKAAGKENLMDVGDIQALKSLSAGSMADGTSRASAYMEAYKQTMDYNKSILDVAKASGLINTDQYNTMKDQPYVPFYRALEDGSFSFPRSGSGLASQYFSKKLKGGEGQLKADLLDNMMQSWAHTLEASAKNRAADQTVKDLSQMAMAYKVPGAEKGTLKIMQDGQATHWHVADPYVAQAMSALNYVPPAYLKPLGVMKRALTYGVTLSPVFKVRTLIRETLAALAQSDIGKNPLENLTQGWKNTSMSSQIFASTLAGGGQIRFGSMERGDMATKMIEKAGGKMADESTMKKWGGMIGDVADIYHEFGNRVENVNRTALYDQLIQKGYNHEEANFASRDLLDFTASGRWPVVKFLTQSVPFMNARMQSLYALGRTAAKNPGAVGTVAGAIALASLGLMWTQQDEEWWKNRDEFDRDAYWAFKVGDQAYYIPKPFELGAIGTMAERTWELAFDKDMDARKWASAAGQTLLNTFSLDPTPQMVKPLVAVWANKDPSTQRPIESTLDQKEMPADRYDENTSGVAKVLGSLGLPNPMSLLQATYNPLSPKQIDYMLKGYFGGMATMATGAVDGMARPFQDKGERPSLTARDYTAGFVRDIPQNQSKYVNDFYQEREKVEQAFQSMSEARQRGDIGKAQEIFQDHQEEISSRPAYSEVEKDVAGINRMLRQVEASTSMSGDAKRTMIDQLNQQRDQVTERLHEALLSRR